ncbi:MAG: DUF4249 domain-containing protein [Bacteroidales bacterium]|jgi:hypothetical protein|nr:DUF4249 domain-containing protein [Bacteroidales bacterium]
MHRIKNIPLIITLLMLFSCIKLYDPQIDSNAKNKYVVSGRITNTEGWQEVDVSLSSPIESPSYVPVSGCRVNILDDKGNIFLMEEYNPGQYLVWIGQEYLKPGISYKVMVVAPGREILVSGFDKMPAGPSIDSVYYSVNVIPTPDPDVNHRVMQFYVDLNAIGNYSQYYKWDVVETWEYHAAHPLEYFYDGTFHEVYPPDYSKNKCWSTNLVKNVFTVSTKSLSQNTYKQYPLHYVDGHTSRLGILYSILVRQLALTEEAYNYWEQLRINSNEQGGLYEKQPLAIKGNIQNATNPDNEVLGYFYATSESTRRYFYHDIEGIPLDFSNSCSEDVLGRFGWREFKPDDYPVYYYYNAVGALKILGRECVDCRLMGGTTEKPDFWPN